MIEALKRRVLCPLGFHVGHPESIGGGWVAFYCTRCETLSSPAPPSVTRALYEGEGHGDLYDEIHDSPDESSRSR